MNDFVFDWKGINAIFQHHLYIFILTNHHSPFLYCSEIALAQYYSRWLIACFLCLVWSNPHPCLIPLYINQLFLGAMDWKGFGWKQSETCQGSYVAWRVFKPVITRFLQIHRVFSGHFRCPSTHYNHHSNKIITFRDFILHIFGYFIHSWYL